MKTKKLNFYATVLMFAFISVAACLIVIACNNSNI